jgi:MFS family permease
MNPLERRATVGLALIYALRMVGMFMILPVFALYAHDLGASRLQAGWAFGIYGLMQAALQIPLGLLSDRIGRKPVIVVGLLVFAAGSVIAGISQSIEGVMLGRAIQGMGAISSAVSALLADVTRSEVRSTAMAILGAGMGLSFIAALSLGPVVAAYIGVEGIFHGIAVAALLAVAVVTLWIPTPPKPVQLNTGWIDILKDRQLLAFDAGILLLHATLTGLFMALPKLISEKIHLPLAQHWQVYLPMLVLSALPVFPLMKWIERRQQVHQGFVAAVCGLLLTLLLLTLPLPLWALVGVLAVFFVAFNFLEGQLPSLISKRAPSDRKGAALGVYGSAQFIGPMLGGVWGGWLAGWLGEKWLFAGLAVFPLCWLLLLQWQRVTPNHISPTSSQDSVSSTSSA